MKKSGQVLWYAIVSNALIVAAALWWVHSSSRRGKPYSPPAPVAVGRAAVSPVAGSQPAQPLVPLQLSPRRLQSIGVTTGVVTRQNVDQPLVTTGNIAVDQDMTSAVQVRFSGWLRTVWVRAPFTFVHAGQPLCTIYSPQLVSTEQEYLLARQNARKLAASTVPGVASGAASLLQAAQDRLRQWLVPPAEIARLRRTGQPASQLTIVAPQAGFITQSLALPSTYVQPGSTLYSIAPINPVWVNAQLFQGDLGVLRPGARAQVTVDALPGKVFPARILEITPDIQPATRTADVRLLVSNPRRLLQPGMYVNVSFQSPLGPQLLVPASAVLQGGMRNIVFVDHGSGNLEPRQVSLAEHVGRSFVVLSGLKAGERVVTSANFLLDAESQLQAAAGSYMPPPPGAPQQDSTPSATVKFTTFPNPPHKGGNQLRVTLRDAHNAPVPDAQVSVIFFMPAMPEMGMSAMRTVASLTSQSAGSYLGSVQLQSAGSWQVTVVATRGGQTIARKKLTINAAL